MMRAPVGRSVPRRRPSSGDEGAVAVLVAITVTLLIVLVAVAVDTARWYVEVARVQKVADAAALGGVVSMPETADAIVEARRIAAANGFVDQVGGVTVLPFGAPSSKTRLYVTVTSPVSNGFGGLFGRPTTPITRTALADYQPNALLGSPCNAFGNEPDSTTAPGTTPAPALPVDSVQPDSPPGWETCDTTPGLWAMIQGPLSNKRNGDRYANRRCTRETPRTYECTDGEFNTEYRDDNYYWTVRVPTEAIGVPVSVQIYDPAYVANGQTCSGFDGAPGDTGSIDFNRYVFPYAPSDASLRYLDDQNEFCTGDLNTTYPTGANGPVNTTFELLYPHPSGDPKLSTPVATCTKQFAGYTGANANEVATRIPTYDRFGNFDRQVASTNYNAGLASVYHQWVNLCTFTPLASQIGDYYLHVSSNIALGAGAPGLTPSPAGVYSYRDGVDVLPDALCPTSGQPRTGSNATRRGRTPSPSARTGLPPRRRRPLTRTSVRGSRCLGGSGCRCGSTTGVRPCSTSSRSSPTPGARASRSLGSISVTAACVLTGEGTQFPPRSPSLRRRTVRVLSHPTPAKELGLSPAPSRTAPSRSAAALTKVNFRKSPCRCLGTTSAPPAQGIRRRSNWAIAGGRWKLRIRQTPMTSPLGTRSSTEMSCACWSSSEPRRTHGLHGRIS